MGSNIKLNIRYLWLNFCLETTLFSFQIDLKLSNHFKLSSAANYGAKVCDSTQINHLCENMIIIMNPCVFI